MKLKISKLVLIIGMVIGLAIPGVSFAQSSFGSFMDFVRNSFSGFQRQLESLRTTMQIEDKATVPDKLTDYLYEGKEGEQVRFLQQFLSQYPDIYPQGDISGIFDSNTKNAVLRFQERHGISTVGYVGPETRNKINDIISHQVRKSEPKISTLDTVSSIISPAATVQLEREQEVAASDVEPEHNIEPKPEYDLESIEIDIQDEVNERRVEAGLEPVEWSESVADVAWYHSSDQADDSRSLVDSSKTCAFPILRHEGFESGLTVGDRLETSGVDYKKAGENLVLFPVSKGMIYRYKMEEGPVEDCPSLERVDLSEGETPREKRDILNKEIEERKELLEEMKPVEWINKEWKSSNEIVDQAVDMWMESEGHRKNLLNEEFNKGGIGVSFAGDYIIITHVLIQD